MLKGLENDVLGQMNLLQISVCFLTDHPLCLNSMCVEMSLLHIAMLSMFI